MRFQATIKTLERRLRETLPGRDAQVRMAPLRENALERTNVSGRNCREAAVLALLHPVHDAAHLVLTIRRGDLTDHAGQVSFPGGRRESDEPLLQTALREAQEEVDVRPDEVVVMGELTPLYIPPTNYCVYPFLGYATKEAALSPHDLEVERIVHVPLADLMDPGAVRNEAWIVRGSPLDVPFFDVAGLQIWGATAMMLAEIIALLDGSNQPAV